MNKKEKFEQKKSFREYISIADKKVLDTKKSGIELITEDEVFVLVNNTHNYWISNHGRLVNNLRGYFHMHKGGNAHYTLSAYDSEGKLCPTDTYCDKLVAEHFLEQPDKHDRVWHIDRNKDNCHYKNLVWVTKREYMDLDRRVLLISELGRQQEYVPYITLKSNVAYQIWNGIYNRCYRTNERNDCYEKSTMCDRWLYDKEALAEWYNANYYECEGESMAVDKDLLYPDYFAGRDPVRNIVPYRL
ncbi:MAG: HNH endonuclease [Hungatella sp.]|nr:HNH endonuclease [Hungatella sp.]